MSLVLSKVVDWTPTTSPWCTPSQRFYLLLRICNHILLLLWRLEIANEQLWTAFTFLMSTMEKLKRAVKPVRINNKILEQY